jgi:hypothetical protein
MTWRPPNARFIWEYYEQNIDEFQMRFHHGMDPFLHYEFYIKQKINTFPLGIFYCHLYGVDDVLHMLDQNGIQAYNHKDFKHITDLFPIVLLNGNTTEKDYQSYSKYYSP